MTLDDLKRLLPNIDTDDDPLYSGVYFDDEPMPDAVGRILLALPNLIAAVELLREMTAYAAMYGRDTDESWVVRRDDARAILKRLGVE